MRKKAFIIFSLGILGLFLSGCGGGGAINSYGNGGKLNLSLAFENRETREGILAQIDSADAPIKAGVKTLTIRVFPAEGDIIEERFEFVKGGSASIPEVPIGPARLEVEAIDSAGILLFSGATNVDVQEDQVTVVEGFTLLIPAPAAEYRLPPLIRDMQIKRNSLGQLYVAFTTNIPTRAVLKVFELKTQKVISEMSADLRDSFVNNHQFLLKNLSSNLQYYLVAEATSENGEVTTSQNFPFTTSLSTLETGATLSGKIELPGLITVSPIPTTDTLTKAVDLTTQTVRSVADSTLTDSTRLVTTQSLDKTLSDTALKALVLSEPLLLFINGKPAAKIGSDGRFSVSGIDLAESYFLEVKTSGQIPLLMTICNARNQVGTTINCQSTAKTLLYQELKKSHPTLDFFALTLPERELTALTMSLTFIYEKMATPEDLALFAGIFESSAVQATMKEILPGVTEQLPALQAAEGISKWLSRFKEMLSRGGAQLTLDELKTLFHRELFLMGGKNLDAFLKDLGSDQDVSQIQFHDLKILSEKEIDGRAWVKIQVRVVFPWESTMEELFFVQEKGQWLFIGDQKIAELRLEPYIHLSSDSNVQTGLRPEINTGGSTQVDYAILKGGHLPDRGLLLLPFKEINEETSETRVGFRIADWNEFGVTEADSVKREIVREIPITAEIYEKLIANPNFEFQLYQKVVDVTSSLDRGDKLLGRYPIVLEALPPHPDKASAFPFPRMSEEQIGRMKTLLEAGGKEEFTLPNMDGFVLRNVHFYRGGAEKFESFDAPFDATQGILTLRVEPPSFPVFHSGIHFWGRTLRGLSVSMDIQLNDSSQHEIPAIRGFSALGPDGVFHSGLAVQLDWGTRPSGCDHISIIGPGLPQTTLYNGQTYRGFLLVEDTASGQLIPANHENPAAWLSPTHLVLTAENLTAIHPGAAYSILYWSQNGTAGESADDTVVFEKTATVYEAPLDAP